MLPCHVFPARASYYCKMELKEFKIYVLALRPKLLNYARQLTEDKEDAEDAVQEVLLKLWKQRDELEQCRSIEAFATTLVHNTCIDMWRRKRNNLPLDRLPASFTADSSPDAQAVMDDEIRLIHHIIHSSLPPLQRTIMLMKDVEGYETEEIAEITGCNAEAIRSNLSRARKKVREIYLRTIQERNRRTPL